MADNDQSQPDSQQQDSRDGSPISSKRRKRAVRACDECRFRKVRCDGLSPCEPCKLSGRFCVYSANVSRNVDPRLRARVLEDRLRVVRAKIEQVKDGKLSWEDADLDTILNPRDGSLLPPEENPGSNEAHDDDPGNDTLDSMMSRYGREETGDPWAAKFYGAPSGVAFIHRMQECFGDGDSSTTEASGSHPSVISNLFDAPLPFSEPADDRSPVESLLPHRQTADALTNVVLARAYPIFLFLREPTFHEMLDRIYTREPLQYDAEDRAYLPLFLLIMGLGYLFSQSEHQKYGCKKAVSQAMKYYMTARRMVDITACRNLRSMQILLCFALFLISTARIASAHAFISLACSSALRLGLHHRSTHDVSISKQDRDTRRNVFWTTIKLDMYVSAVLGLPAFLDVRDVDPAIDLTVAEVLEEANSGLPDRDAVLLGGAAKHLEIMRTISKAIKTLYPNPTFENEASGTNGNISVSIRSLEEIETQFRTWGESTSSLLEKGDDGSTEFIRMKYELEITSFFGKLVLYRPFLHYLGKSSNGRPTSQRASQRALACIRIASTAITRSETIQELGLLRPASWTSVYTIFLSVVCLVFLIATREGTQRPVEAWRKAESGIRLLAATQCHETCSFQCLEILKQLIKHLSHTVNLEIDRIESATGPVCQTSVPFDDRPGKEARPQHSQGSANSHYWSEETKHHDVRGAGDNAVLMTSTALPLQPQAPTSEVLEDESLYNPTMSLPPLSFPHVGNASWSATTHGFQQQAQNPTVNDEMIDLPGSQQFNWPHQIGDKYFDDVIRFAEYKPG
ncbi:Gypsy retrotransposon integrase-like protein 1 [Exophiala sideris]|uniref:Gypsy retrotransposon integrase-like protein 1 n=1 Tax=Exophiala sideris TaxID=1016849 RepID=A0ABR0J3T8_9EURO|nr:Gypsy retrotransposon integrase-like protein 1 [Exophiala sideris]KAK5033969.1 Gypsy retrotransposon integrase-like protein 1 [Exophiala sideris]KAK5055757.1 Gypsy retrotransposon integrase-like protein 1 [Exophiala sideris]KAK5180911.1 Gypsy retrotransposon integrase-like protein 1 [Eurotiomycetes sp. CCFEE 6388]